MAAVRPIRRDPPEPTSLHVQAMDNLRFIRSTMESAGSFTAVPGQGGVLMGATALFAAFVAQSERESTVWLKVWIAEALLALAIGLGFSYRKATQNSTPLLSKPFRRFVLAVAPSVFAGALLDVSSFTSGASIKLLPAMWLLLYGAGITSGGAFAVRVVPVMGMSFLALGSVATLAPVKFADLLLAIGFGGFHIVFGWVDREALRWLVTVRPQRRRSRGRQRWPEPGRALSTGSFTSGCVWGSWSALSVNESLTFRELKKILDTTDGNLSVHARKLEEAGYVGCEKMFDGRLPRTEYRLTDAGRKALENYLTHMEALIRATRQG